MPDRMLMPTKLAANHVPKAAVRVVAVAAVDKKGDKKMQVAIVSTDAVNVDEHFGRATRFLIYEISGDTQVLMKIKEVQSLSDGDKNHEFNPDRFSAVAERLEGCKRVYCTKVGDRPAKELEKLGIEPVIYEGLIERLTV